MPVVPDKYLQMSEERKKSFKNLHMRKDSEECKKPAENIALATGSAENSKKSLKPALTNAPKANKLSVANHNLKSSLQNIFKPNNSQKMPALQRKEFKIGHSFENAKRNNSQASQKEKSREPLKNAAKPDSKLQRIRSNKSSENIKNSMLQESQSPPLPRAVEKEEAKRPPLPKKGIQVRVNVEIVAEDVHQQHEEVNVVPQQKVMNLSLPPVPNKLPKQEKAENKKASQEKTSKPFRIESNERQQKKQTDLKEAVIIRQTKTESSSLQLSRSLRVIEGSNLCYENNKQPDASKASKRSVQASEEASQLQHEGFRKGSMERAVISEAAEDLYRNSSKRKSVPSLHDALGYDDVLNAKDDTTLSSSSKAKIKHFLSDKLTRVLFEKIYKNQLHMQLDQSLIQASPDKN